jgi:hypothetical protein
MTCLSTMLTISNDVDHLVARAFAQACAWSLLLRWALPLRSHGAYLTELVKYKKIDRIG